MKYAVNDVVWCLGKAGVVKSVNKDTYDIRFYDGSECTANEKSLGRKNNETA